jgi:energy-coupling factor transporter ATP-binding protein EcfA2
VTTAENQSQASEPHPTFRYEQQADYLSARGLGNGTLPWFSLIAGPNGSGKTHFLQAIAQGYVRLFIDNEAIDPADIRLLDWNTMHADNQSAAQPSAIMQRVEQLWSYYNSQLTSAQVHQRLTEFLGRNPSLARSDVLSGDPSATVNDRALALESERQNSSLRDLMLEHSGNDLPLLQGIAQAAGSGFLGLGQREFRRLAQLQLGGNDPLQQQLSQTFLAYKSLQDENELAMRRHQDGVEGQVFLSAPEFESAYGPPPWEVLDGLLADRGLNFTVTKPESGNDTFAIEMVNGVSNITVPFANLSSGERVLVGLSVAVYGVSRSQAVVKVPRVLLLDEIDAPLHPEMTRTMLEMLRDAFIANRCAILLTTHNISTVALSRLDSVIYMSPVAPRLEDVHVGVAISRLSAGITALPFDNAERIICSVESPIDADLYTRVASSLGSVLGRSSSLVFLPARATRSEGGRSVVVEAVRSHRNDGRLVNYFGIVDRDTSDIGEFLPPIYSLGYRYAIENYLCDPLLVAALLAREKLLGSERYSALRQAVGVAEHPGTWGGLRIFSGTQLQVVVDEALALLAFQGDSTLEMCELVGGASVNLPRWFLDYRGHDLVQMWLDAVPELNRYGTRENGLVRAVGSLVVPDVPELLSADFTRLFGEIEAAFLAR